MIHLAAFLYPTGYHVGAWRLPDVEANGGWNLNLYADMTRAAEAACFDFVFLADSLAMRGDDFDVLSRSAIRYVAQFEPLTLVSALSALTTRIGFVASVSTTYTHPYQLARWIASAELISNGRIGWNLVTSQNQFEALNFGFESHPEHSDRYSRAHEFVEVVRALWNSWDSDSLILDKETGQFFDPRKVRVANHSGERFRVRGPLNVPRSPQDQPVIMQAGASEAGRELAARTAEVVFTAQDNLSDAIAFRTDIRDRATAANRDPDKIRIMPGIMPIVGSTKQEAYARLEQMNSLVEPTVGLSLLEGQLGEVDLTELSVDQEVPNLCDTNASKSRQQLLIKLAHRNGWTIRELYEHVASSRGHLLVVDEPAAIVDLMEEWHRKGAADGFNIMPASNPHGLNTFIANCVPVLRKRKLIRDRYIGSTLRSHLDLSR